MDDVVAAARPITVEDVLSCRAGGGFAACFGPLRSHTGATRFVTNNRRDSRQDDIAEIDVVHPDQL